MSTLPQHDAPVFFWIDAHMVQQGPETLDTVIERLAYQQIPDTTPVWWQGAQTWTAFNSNPELVAILQHRLAPAPAPAPEMFAPAADPYSEQAYSAPATDPYAAPAADPYAQPAADPYAAYAAPEAATRTEPAYAEPAYAEPAYAEPTYANPAPTDNPFAQAANQSAAPAAAAAAATTSLFDTAPSTEMPSVVMPVDEPTTTEPTPESPFAPAAEWAQPAPEPAAEAAPAPALNLGDAATLSSTFAAMQQRTEAASAERDRAGRLDDTLAAYVQHAATNLGFTVDTHALTETQHSFTLASPDGSTAALTVGRGPAAATIAEATERPVEVTVHHGGAASTGLFLADYLRSDDSLDAELLTHHLAAVVNAANQAG